MVRFGVHLKHIGCRKVKTKATTLIFLERIERGEFPAARRRTRARTRTRVHMSGIPPLAAGPTSSPGHACARARTKSAIAPLAAGQQPPAFQSFDRLAGWPQELNRLAYMDTFRASHLIWVGFLERFWRFHKTDTPGNTKSLTQA